MSLAAITSGHYLDDAALTTRIWIAIHLRRLPSADALRVVVRGGEVALQGSVATTADRRSLIGLVSHVAGVLRVVDKTSLAPQAPPHPAATACHVVGSPVRRRGCGPSVVRSLALLALASALAGCSEPAADRAPTYPVSGSITWKGQPLPGAFVALHPRQPQPSVPAPRASVDRDGILKVSTYDGGDGAPEGEYVVTVQWYKPIRRGGEVVPGPNAVPEKYASPRTSNIVIRVAAQENVLPPIQL